MHMRGDRAGSGNQWGRFSDGKQPAAHPGAIACLYRLAYAAGRFLEKHGPQADSEKRFARYLAGCRRINTAPSSPRNLFRK